MRLVECYISNFGCLHENKIRFVRGMNTVLKENGWGKSTFAAFLLAMFYGFDNDKKKNPAEKPRSRYAPWQGGIYGGTVTFELEGKRWRLERTFGTESAREDRLLAFDAETNLRTDRFGAVPGESIFSVDMESFRRTVFLAQHDCRTYVTSGISAKIGDVSAENADMGGYSDAQERIRKEILSLTPKRKTGMLAKLADQIALLEAELSEGEAAVRRAERVDAELGQAVREKEACAGELGELQERIRQAGLIKDRQAELEKYRGFQREMDRAMEVCAQQRAFFPGDVPEEAVVEDWVKRASALESSGGYALRPGEEAEYRKLRERFGDVPPSGEIMEQYRRKAGQIRTLEERIAAMNLSPSEQKAYDAERELFLWNAPEEGQMDRMIREWEERCTIRRGMAERKQNLRTLKAVIKMNEAAVPAPEEPAEEEAAEEEEKKTAIGGYRIKAGLILLVAALVYLFIDKNGLPGIGLVVAGFLLLAWGLSVRVAEGREKKEKKPEEKKPVENGNTSAREQYRAILKGMREDDAYAAEIEDRISTFIGSFKLEVEEEEVAGLLHRLRSDAAEYRRLGKRLQALRDTHYEEQRDGLEKEVRDFLGQYYPEENAEQLSLDAGIQKLSYDAERYRTFASMHSENREAAAPESDREEALRAEMQRFRLIPGQDLRMQIAEISGHRRALATAEEDFARRKAEKEACEQELRAGSLRGRIDASAGGMTASLEELTERYHQRQEKADELAKRIVHLQAEKRALAEKTERLTEAEAELSGRRSEYGELSHRYEVLTRTADYLRKAKLNFSGRYMRPMQESFEKYEELLTGNVSGNFQMDADLNVTVQKDGMSRDVAWLSEGWQDLIGLCRRMSMIEAMYGGEKPFLVLDDPFVNLDGERLERALAFLKKASAEYQILYFSCHESRADALLPQKRSGSAGKHV